MKSFIKIIATFNRGKKTTLGFPLSAKCSIWFSVVIVFFEILQFMIRISALPFRLLRVATGAGTNYSDRAMVPPYQIRRGTSISLFDVVFGRRRPCIVRLDNRHRAVLLPLFLWGTFTQGSRLRETRFIRFDSITSFSTIADWLLYVDSCALLFVIEDRFNQSLPYLRDFIIAMSLNFFPLKKISFITLSRIVSLFS